MKTKILKSFLLFAAMIPFITSCAVPKVGEDYESKEPFLYLKTDSEETRHKQVLRIN